MVSFTALLTAPLLIASVANAACHKAGTSTRRHHAKQQLASTSASAVEVAATAVALNAAGYEASSSSFGSSTSSAASSSSSSSSSSDSSSNGSSTIGRTLKGSKKNGIFIGFLPDDGSGGNPSGSQSMADIDGALNIKSAAQGWYAQAHAGTLFDGSQLTSRMDQIVAHGGLFQPAVMPIGGWKGLTYDDDSQAVAICQVMKKFTDKGLEVWLRFAHEVNWYQRDGTYQGDAADFKEGWAVVARACRTIAPEVKMWFTPNVDTLDNYKSFFPDDVNTVDIIGVDYYPAAGALDFVQRFKPFHDEYCSDKLKFAIGETGLATGATMKDRLDWFKDTVSAETAAAMPHHMQVSWFNYHKGYEFRIAAVDGDWATKQFLA